MFESFKVAAVLELTDMATPKVTRLLEKVTRLNSALTEVNDKLRVFGRGNRILSTTNKLRKLNEQLAVTTDRAAAAGAALHSAGGSTFFGGRGRGGNRGGGSHGGSGRIHGHYYAGPVGARFGLGMAGLGAVGLGYGLYKNAELQDTIQRIFITANAGLVPGSKAYKRHYDVIKNMIQGVAMQTGEGIGELSQGALAVTRNMSGFSLGARESVIKRALMFGALEHRFRPSVATAEAAESLSGLMHQQGIYSPKLLNRMEGSMFALSLMTPLNMMQIARAASYAVPVLKTAEGINPTIVMGMLAYMQRAGITNTKSGTWVSSLFTNILPKTLGSGLFHTGHQAAALERLGLVNTAGKSLVVNSKGQVDALKTIETLEKHLMTVPLGERMQVLTQAFGKRGARAAAVLASPQFIKQWPGLYKFMQSEAGKTPEQLYSSLYKGSAIQKAIQAREKLVVLLMKLTNVLLPDLNKGLDTLNSILSPTIGAANRHPEAAGLAGTAGAAGVGLGALAWLRRTRIAAPAFRFLGLAGPEGAAVLAAGTALFAGYDWYTHTKFAKHHSSIFEAGGEEAVHLLQSLEDMITGAVHKGINGSTIHMKDDVRGKIHRATHPTSTSGDTGAIIPNPPAR